LYRYSHRKNKKHLWKNEKKLKKLNKKMKVFGYEAQAFEGFVDLVFNGALG